MQPASAPGHWTIRDFPLRGVRFPHIKKYTTADEKLTDKKAWICQWVLILSGESLYFSITLYINELCVYKAMIKTTNIQKGWHTVASTHILKLSSHCKCGVSISLIIVILVKLLNNHQICRLQIMLMSLLLFLSVYTPF